MLTRCRLRLGSVAPNFQAETTNGPIDFHEFIGDKWVVLFSHPEDYTPVRVSEIHWGGVQLLIGGEGLHH